MSRSLHDRDFHGWVQQHCDALRALPAVSPWSRERARDPEVLCDTCGDWTDQAP